MNRFTVLKSRNRLSTMTKATAAAASFATRERSGGRTFIIREISLEDGGFGGGGGNYGAAPTLRRSLGGPLPPRAICGR